MKKVILYCIFFVFLKNVSAQSVAINNDGSTAATSSMLDIKSTTKGLLIPRMSKAQRNAVVSPSSGLLAYQIAPDSTGFYYYDGSNWKWLTDNKKSDTTYWGLHGNTNTNPPSSSFLVPINYATDTYLGTFEPKDVSMLAGGNELLRLKQFATGGRIGLANRNPEYSLDVRTTEINNETQIQGLRVISKNLYDINSPNIDKGLVIGHNPTNENDMAIWNHANNINGTIRFGLDSYNNTVRPAFNITGTGQGINQRNPLYFLDIHSQSQFAAANTNLTNKNGIRISYPDQENTNNLQRGLFMGVSTNSTLKSYIWNYADGFGGNNPDRAIYFGLGGDMTSGYPPTMELQDGKIMIGRITDPNHFFPSTLNIQTDYASGVAKNGISVMQHNSNNESAYFGLDDANNLSITKYGTQDIILNSNNANHLIIKQNGKVGIGTSNPIASLHIVNDNPMPGLMTTLHSLPTNTNGFYTGLQSNFTNDALVWNFQNAPIIFGTNNLERMRITANGNIGIGENNPNYLLNFASTLGDKISLWGNASNHYGFGIQPFLLQMHTGGSSDNIAFGYGNSAAFTERARIINDGEYGMQLTGRMVLRTGTQSAGLWLNDNANSTTPAFIGMVTDNHVGFYGAVNGWSLVTNTLNGNTGIGTLAPSEKLEINGKIKITDGTQATGRVLVSDATGVGTWTNNIALTPAVQGTFAGGGVTFGNGTPSGGSTAWFYANTYIDLPAGKWMVFGTYLLNGTLPADAGVFIRTTFSDSNTGSGACSPNVISGCLLSGTLLGPVGFSLANGQTVINNTTGTAKRYYMWANMEKFGTTPTAFNLNAIGSNFWSENQLTAIPMN